MGDVRTERLWPHVVLALLTTGVLIGVPWLAFTGVAESVSLFGGEPSHWELGRPWLLAALWAGIGGPVAGILLAEWALRRGFTWFFGIFLAAVLLVWMVSQPATPREPVPREPGACQEYSGGDTECPGG